MQFKVPQFIDIEDKLFGPLTFKQFAYLVGGGGMMFVLYKLLPFWLAVVPMLAIGAFSAALAFYKINSKPFIYYVQAALTFALKSKLYVWKQRLYKKDKNVKEDLEDIKKVSVVPTVSSSKLKDLSWSLDVLDKK